MQIQKNFYSIVKGRWTRWEKFCIMQRKRMKTRFVWSKQASETASGKCHNDMKKSPNFIQNLYKMYFIFCWDIARTYLQLPLQQWVASNVYLLVLFSWKVNIAENPIGVMGL